MFGWYSPPGWTASDWVGGCLGGTHLWAGQSLTGWEGVWVVLTSGLGSLTGWEGVWVVLTSGLGGHWMGGRVCGCLGSTYPWAGWPLTEQVFGWYSPPGWAVSDWAGGCLGGTHLRDGRALDGREGLWEFGQHLPLGWAASDWAGGCLGSTHLRARRAGIVRAVLTSGLGGLWVGGPPSRCIHLCALICDREYRRFGSTTNIRRIRCSHSTKQDRS